MQLQQQHKHKQSTSANIIPFIRSKRSKNKQLQPSQQGQQKQYIPKLLTLSSNLSGLEIIHQQSIRQLSSSLICGISQRKKFSQTRIYEGTVNNAMEFVGIHLRELKPNLKFEMKSMFNNIHNDIQVGIWNGKYTIQSSHNKSNEKADNQRGLITLIAKELMVKHSNEQNDVQWNDQQSGQHLSVLVTNHAKTEEAYKRKKAEEFVNKMRQKKAQTIEQRTKRLQQQNLKEFNNLQQQKNDSQIHRQQKKQLIKRRMQKKGQFMSLQRQRKQKINNDYRKMIESYKKPLFKDMQQKYQKSMLKQKRQKYHYLQNLKNQRSLNFDQINQHMAKYTELLQQQDQFRQQKRQLRQSKQQAYASRKPLRSKFHSLIVRKSPKIDQNILKAQLKLRQNDYADYVRNNFIPRIDDKKKQQIQKLIKRISKQEANDYHIRKYMNHGKKNLQILHQMIQQFRSKGLIKNHQELQFINMPKQVSKRYKNYLDELKKATENDQQRKLLNVQSTLKKDDDQIRLISKQKQANAKQKQLFLNSSIQNIDFQTHMEGNMFIERNYIDATRAKIALLKKYQLVSSQVNEKNQQT